MAVSKHVRRRTRVRNIHGMRSLPLVKSLGPLLPRRLFARPPLSDTCTCGTGAHWHRRQSDAAWDLAIEFNVKHGEARCNRVVIYRHGSLKPLHIVIRASPHSNFSMWQSCRRLVLRFGVDSACERRPRVAGLPNKSKRT